MKEESEKEKVGAVQLGLLGAGLAAFGVEQHARGEVADAGLAPVQQFLCGSEQKREKDGRRT